MKHQRMSQLKRVAMPGGEPARMVLKRKSRYDVIVTSRAKHAWTETEENEGMELDDDKKGKAPVDMLD